MTAALQTLQAPTRLTVLYDESCALCRRARDWLLTQPCLVEVELLPAGSIEATKRYGALPWLGKELVVVDEHGQMWIGPAGYLVCMWATARYRGWAFRLSRPSLQPHAERFFRWVSKRRDRLGRWVGTDDEDCSWCEPAGTRARHTGTTDVGFTFAQCVNGHYLGPNANYCRTCGAPRPAGA